MTETVISRKVIFPKPVISSMFNLIILEGEMEILMKFELLGMTNEENYDLNPFMDEASAIEGTEKETNKNSHKKIKTLLWFFSDVSYDDLALGRIVNLELRHLNFVNVRVIPMRAYSTYVDLVKRIRRGKARRMGKQPENILSFYIISVRFQIKNFEL